MGKALQKLREEVASLQEEEKGKLEEEKRKALDRLQAQVRLISSIFCLLLITWQVQG